MAAGFQQARKEVKFLCVNANSTSQIDDFFDVQRCHHVSGPFPIWAFPMSINTIFNAHANVGPLEPLLSTIHLLGWKSCLSVPVTLPRSSPSNLSNLDHPNLILPAS